MAKEEMDWNAVDEFIAILRTKLRLDRITLQIDELSDSFDAENPALPYPKIKSGMKNFGELLLAIVTTLDYAEGQIHKLDPDSSYGAEKLRAASKYLDECWDLKSKGIWGRILEGFDDRIIQFGLSLAISALIDVLNMLYGHNWRAMAEPRLYEAGYENLHRM